MGDKLIYQDTVLFSNIFNEYYTDLVLYAESIIFDQEFARDLVQDIFLSLWKQADTIEINTSLKNYLFRSVRNKALDHLRHNKVTDINHQLIREAGIISGIQHSEEESVDDQLYNALNQLPPQCRKIIELKVFQGLKYDEIAQMLGVSVNTVKTQIKIGYRILRQAMSSDLLRYIILGALFSSCL
ncbi:MAG: RNA polymerase sigma-70 factor [Bacteroidota bacterium]|nr:RNA polymerase sigma-70 factor [Bacteroidota bacterium]